MTGNFTEILYASLEWTKTVLFRPFLFKKWIFLAVIAVLSMEFSGCNLNMNFPAGRNRHETNTVETADIQNPAETVYQDTTGGLHETAANNKGFWIVLLFILLGIIAFSFIIVFTWIYSRFSLVFLSAIVKNDASIKIPFIENKNSGNSYFKWNLLMFFVFLVTVISVTGVIAGCLFLFKNMHIAVKILLIIFPAIFALLIVLIALGIINVIVRDLILPVMYKNKSGIISSWKEICPVLSREKIEIIKYLLAKALLRLITAVASGFIMTAVFIVTAIPVGMVFTSLFLASSALPQMMSIALNVVLITLVVIIAMCMILILNVIFLPIPVFFRTFSLKFLARLDEKYNLYRLIP